MTLNVDIIMKSKSSANVICISTVYLIVTVRDIENVCLLSQRSVKLLRMSLYVEYSNMLSASDYNYSRHL